MTEAELRALKDQMDRIEVMLIQVRDFTDATAEAVAPFLSGKGHKWLALVAKAKGGRT